MLKTPIHLPNGLTRRRLLTIGAGSALAAAAGIRPAQAVLKLDVTQGNMNVFGSEPIVRHKCCLSYCQLP